VGLYLVAIFCLPVGLIVAIKGGSLIVAAGIFAGSLALFPVTSLWQRFSMRNKTRDELISDIKRWRGAHADDEVVDM